MGGHFWSGVQGASGLVFGGFLALHAANTVCAVAGPEAFNQAQTTLRAVYQHPVAEAAVLASLVLHVVASIVKRVTDSAKAEKKAQPWLSRKTVHTVSGYVTLSVVFLHIFAVRFSPPEGVRLQFNALAHTIMRLNGVFYTYYLVFGAAAVAHMLLGLPTASLYTRRWLGGVVRVFPRVPNWLVAAGVAAIALGVSAIAGCLYPVTVDTSDPFTALFDTEFAALKGTPLWREV